MDIKNKTVLVTGTNRGIGEAIVSALLNRDVAKIYSTARDISKLKDLGDSRVIPVELDITKEEDIKRVSAEINDLDILINNAGVATHGSLLQLNRQQLINDLDVNYFGTLNMAKAFAPVLEKNGGGAIVNNISIAAFANFPALGGYCASKAAAYSLTQGIRIELAPKSITVHGIYPGPIDTDMAKDFPMEKTSPQDCANGILDGLEKDEINIFPDAIAKQLHEIWQKDYLELESAINDMG